MIFELLIPQRPLSVGADRKRLKRWQSAIRERAKQEWTNPPIETGGLQFTLVYLSGRNAADVDNIIKPVQDALRGLVYSDDKLVTDVDSHRRPALGEFDIVRLPAKLVPAATAGHECVYVRVSTARALEDYL